MKGVSKNKHDKRPQPKKKKEKTSTSSAGSLKSSAQQQKHNTFLTNHKPEVERKVKKTEQHITKHSLPKKLNKTKAKLLVKDIHTSGTVQVKNFKMQHGSDSEKNDLKRSENSPSESDTCVKAKGTEKQTAVRKDGESSDYLPPRDPQNFSANWKKLLQTMETEKTHSLGASTQHRNRQRREYKGKKRDTKGTKSKSESTAPQQGGPDIWFDDVDDALIDHPHPTPADPSKTDPLTKPGSFAGLTKAVAMDCEMVGTGDDGRDSMLARVSLVNQFGHCIYDTFVKPKEKVTDFRTHVSGVRRQDIKNGKEFSLVQREVSAIIKGRILVGHALQNDMKVLYMSHPGYMVRDTQRYPKFRQLMGGKRPALKKLSDKVLGVQVQQGEHSSIQDAQAAMRLYTMYKKQWEKDIKTRKFKKAKSKTEGQF